MPYRLSRLTAILVLGGALVAITAALLTPAVGAVLGAHQTAPVTEIDLDALSQRSRVLDVHGNLMTYLYREENRQVVRLDEVPPVLVDSVLQVEDEQFWQHNGVNVRAIGRAFLTNVEAGDVQQGGSTITQQLVKNALLGSEQSIGRKVKEAVLAVRLEEEMSKTEILERYLNTVYLGNGTYGVQAAAELYFGVDARDLARSQAAFLAGLIRNPVGYDPFVYPEASLERRNLIVDVLAERGSIPAEDAEAIKRSPIPSEPYKLVPTARDYFLQEILNRLLADPRLGETQSERYTALFRGGLTIKTTFDPAKQWHATAAVHEVLPDTDGMFTAALVSVEPGTGAVRAMVGGPGFETAKYNIATQGIGRQPGSAFKPIVLAAALEKGISPKSTVNGSAPCRLPNEGGTPDPWPVDNYEGSAGGVMDLYRATQKSMNCAFARLALITGLGRVVRTAERLGISTPMSEVPSMALGSLEVRPIDMAAAFAAFANDGVFAEPYFVEEIRDRDGEVVFQHEPVTRRAVSVDTARTVNEILTGVVTSGTGTRARFADRRPTAGKTGTTSNYADAWYVGYTPQLSTAVWMGSPTGTEDKMTNVGGIRVTGGSYPARIWQAFMGRAMEGMEPLTFAEAPKPERGEYLYLEGEPSRPPTTTTTSTTVVGDYDETDDGDEDDEEDEDEEDRGRGGDKPPSPDDQEVAETGQTAGSG